MTDLQYPIGKYTTYAHIDADERRKLIQQIADAPAQLRAAVQGLTEEQLDTPYRPEGWTVRQVVHHLPDSHLNAYVRMKLALTENAPTVKTYEEHLWAELDDASHAPVEVSLSLVDALHQRWALFLTSLHAEDFSRTITHPADGIKTVDQLLQVYAWHGRHHIAHITSLRNRNNW